MKKTKLMRAALLLLVLTLITSCFVGGTFAKYVTSGDGKDIARVAKWGVVIDAKGATFAEEYATNDQSVVGTIAKSVVSSEDDKNVVAPGTRGDMVKMTITGTPEVAVRVNYTATFDVEGWNITDTDGTSKFYCPLQIKVGTTTIDGTKFTREDLFEDAVNTEISTYSKNYAAGTDLSTASVTTPSVSWEWPFFVNNADDVKDTALGDLAANGNAPTVSLTITTTVTQID